MIIYDLKTIGENIRKARAKKGISQDEAAWQAGISLRTYADIERGSVNARIGTILKICDILEITPNMVMCLGEIKDNALTKEELFERIEILPAKKRNAAYAILEEYLNAVAD